MVLLLLDPEEVGRRRTERILFCPRSSSDISIYFKYSYLINVSCASLFCSLLSQSFWSLITLINPTEIG